jgi:hypothetical protein
MRRLLLPLLLLLPSTALADRLGGLKAGANVALSTQVVTGGNTNYIQNTNSPQSANFNVSSGTVAGAMDIGADANANSLYLTGPFNFTGAELKNTRNFSTSNATAMHFLFKKPSGSYDYWADIYVQTSSGTVGDEYGKIVWEVMSGGSISEAFSVEGDAAGERHLNIPPDSTLRFYSGDSSGNYHDYQAPTYGGSPYAFTLPASDGLSGQFLKTDGSGALSFDTPAGGSGGGYALEPATVTIRAEKGLRAGVITINSSLVGVTTHYVVLASATATGSVTYTLPAATSTGSIVQVFKVDGATHPVIVQRAGSDLIGGTTTQLRINTQGASAELKADGLAGWWGRIPADLMYAGPENKWGMTTGAVVAANQAIVLAFNLTEYFTARGVILQITASSGNIDVGLFDARTRVKLASSGATGSPGTGQQFINFTAPVHLKPGSYYVATATDNTTFAGTRCANQSTFGAMIASTHYPLPDTLSDPPGSQTGTVWCMTLSGVDGMTR